MGKLWREELIRIAAALRRNYHGGEPLKKFSYVQRTNKVEPLMVVGEARLEPFISSNTLSKGTLVGHKKESSSFHFFFPFCGGIHLEDDPREQPK